jgi:hypothetical protein
MKDQFEIVRRKKIMEDFIGLSAHIPQELRASLDLFVSPLAKPHVLELQMIAIQYGRALERRDRAKRIGKGTALAAPA